MVERRLTILPAIVLLWGAAILKNLISLQVIHHREYAVRARSIQEVVEDIPAPRGTIFDRDGRPLAMSLASRTVFITADRREGLTAFLEKRPARFEGR